MELIFHHVCPTQIETRFVHLLVIYTNESRQAVSVAGAIIRHILLNNGFITNGMSNFHNFVFVGLDRLRYEFICKRTRPVLLSDPLSYTESVSFARLFVQTRKGVDWVKKENGGCITVKPHECSTLTHSNCVYVERRA